MECRPNDPITNQKAALHGQSIGLWLGICNQYSSPRMKF
ncbi:Protein of unknown function [Pyronema omphalodes CBS 100304]|uniref:Uncharacterized protein n=1 Tax=Pyronema omphalodes (strain CBS 100304) TaxID=1076935 RepID=U4LKG4_PYROM|nr:Protein of unknown function [Pyronema omphalodes CBS 100304]